MPAPYSTGPLAGPKYTYAEFYEERAAILEYDHGLIRQEAEKEAFRQVLAEFQGAYPQATEEALKLGVKLRRENVR